MDGPFERWVDGFLFSLSGPIYAGTNEIQRNIIADRVLQLPRGLTDALRVHRRPEALRRRPARPARQGVHARATCARSWESTAPATTPRCGSTSPRWACSAMLVPEAAGGLGGTEVDLVLLLEELGRAAVPGPVARDDAVGRSALAGTELVARHRRRRR